MKVFGLVGWSGSGKTTLLVNLIPELTARGLSVSTMKHTHHNFDIDRKGKDSYEHRAAGAFGEENELSSFRWLFNAAPHVLEIPHSNLAPERIPRWFPTPIKLRTRVPYDT